MSRCVYASGHRLVAWWLLRAWRGRAAGVPLAVAVTGSATRSARTAESVASTQSSLAFFGRNLAMIDTRSHCGIRRVLVRSRASCRRAGGSEDGVPGYQVGMPVVPV